MASVLARSEVLGGKLPFTVKLFPIDTYWFLKSGFNTKVDDAVGHFPNCIIFWAHYIQFDVTRGEWRLKSPIDIRSVMPGTDHTITYVELKSMIRTEDFTAIRFNDREFTIFGDDDILWSVKGEQIGQNEKEWKVNRYATSVPLSGYSTLDVRLFAHLLPWFGQFETHFKDILFTIEFVPEKPPEPATVSITVVNQETGEPIGGVFVRLLSGQKIVAQGTTDRNGNVVFKNIPAGFQGVSYTLEASKSGYEPLTDVIEVKPGINAFKIALVKKRFRFEDIFKEIPMEWLVVGGAVVLFGGLLLLRGRRGERIIVVK